MAIGRVSQAEFDAELARLDADTPNTGGLPVCNVLAVPHSGSRSVAQHKAAQGYHTRLIHLQQHYHQRGFLEQLQERQYCVAAVRDPMLVLGSAMARSDDSVDYVLLNLDDFYAMAWPSEVYAVGVDQSLPTVGNFGNYQFKAAYKIPDKAAARVALGGAMWDAVAARQLAYQSKLQAAGFSNLPWWA